MNLLKFNLLFISLTLCLYSASAQYNQADASEYAHASALAYCAPPNILNWNCGANCQNLPGYKPFFSQDFPLSLVETISFSMIYNPNSRRFVTTFRGAVGALQILIEVTRSGAVPYTLTNIPGAVALDYFYTNYVNVLRATLFDQLRNAHAAFPDYQFVFTGHSLGASLATLAAFDVVSSGLIPNSQVVHYNYGSPRTGNYIFANAVNAAVSQVYRVVHWADPAPHLPPCNIDLRNNCVQTSIISPIYWPAWHVTQEIFYDEGFTNYRICQGNEDPACGDQFGVINLNIVDHGAYLGAIMHC
jgi:hypothetical protein